MGQGEEVIINAPAAVEIQERGEIYFFYRPKVGKEEAHSSDDVQRLYIVLRPESAEPSTQTEQEKDVIAKQPAAATTEGSGGGAEVNIREVNIEKNLLLRFIVMGRKSLPDPAAKKKSRPFWGFVELVTTKIQDVKDALKGEEYNTKTRGHRHKPAARALGEGVYRILKHHYSGAGDQCNNKKKKMHTHLVYKLEFPSSSSSLSGANPQEDLNVKREGSYLIQIKNPMSTQKKQQQRHEFRGLGRKRRAMFPAHLQGLFGKLDYHVADPPDFLNYEGCEFLLISACDDIEKELGLEIRVDASCSDLVYTFGETTSTEALLKGIWV